MKRSLRLPSVLLLAVELLLAFTIEADARHKRHKPKQPPFGILIQVTIDWHNSGQTFCSAYNLNGHPVTAYFDISPGFPPMPHATVGPMYLGVTDWTPVAYWLDGTPGISCKLTAPWPT